MCPPRTNALVRMVSTDLQLGEQRTKDTRSAATRNAMYLGWEEKVRGRVERGDRSCRVGGKNTRSAATGAAGTDLQCRMVVSCQTKNLWVTAAQQNALMIAVPAGPLRSDRWGRVSFSLPEIVWERECPNVLRRRTPHRAQVLPPPSPEGYRQPIDGSLGPTKPRTMRGPRPTPHPPPAHSRPPYPCTWWF